LHPPIEKTWKQRRATARSGALTSEISILKITFIFNFNVEYFFGLEGDGTLSINGLTEFERPRRGFQGEFHGKMRAHENFYGKSLFFRNG
jgi:hypothetical protein